MNIIKHTKRLISQLSSKLLLDELEGVKLASTVKLLLCGTYPLLLLFGAQLSPRPKWLHISCPILAIMSGNCEFRSFNTCLIEKQVHPLLGSPKNIDIPGNNFSFLSNETADPPRSVPFHGTFTVQKLGVRVLPACFLAAGLDQTLLRLTTPRPLWGWCLHPTPCDSS
jgi:hypothetical protein